MKNKQASFAENDARSTTEYAQAKCLLNEKREIQARLREVDRKLRDLEMLAVGVTRLARDDLDRDTRGFHA